MIQLLNVLGIYSPVFLAMAVFLASLFVGKVANGLFYLAWIFILTFVRILVNHLASSMSSTASTTSSTEMGEHARCDALGLGWGQGWIYPIYVLSISFFYFSVPMFLIQKINYSVLLTLLIAWVGTSFLLYGYQNCRFSAQEYLGNAVGGAGLGTLVAFGMYASPMRDALYFTPSSSSSSSSTGGTKKQTFRCAVSPTGEILSPKG